MKRLLALLLALLMVMSLAACGGSKTEEAPADEPEATEAAEDAGDADEAEGAADEAEAPADEAEAPASGESLAMGTGGESGTYYAYGGVLATYLKQETGLDITVNATGGSAANITGIDQGMYDLSTVQSDVLGYAYNGTNTFEETGAVTSFVSLGALYAETVQLVTCDPDIKSVADMKGKNVCVGDVGSGTYYNTVDILAAYDMTLDDITPVYQSFGDSAESLKDGKIDVAVQTAGAPTPAITDLAATKDVYLVSIDEEHMEKLLADAPWYASYTIPAGTYKGCDEDCTTITTKATLIARADIDEDTAYTIVSTIFDNKDAITELHAKGAELDLTFATEGIAAPFAAGAAKYYAEHDIEVQVAE